MPSINSIEKLPWKTLRNYVLHFIDTCTTHTYQKPAKLVINDQQKVEIIHSNEGCTQGDVTAMALYALGIKPLIDHLANTVDSADCAQCWFADDSSAGGKLAEIKKWWDELRSSGPKYGYFPLPRKTVLIVKEEFLDAATQMFENTEITISSTGERHMGAWVGSQAHKEKYVSDKVEKWVEDVEELSRIAKNEPQAAYTCYTKAISHRWSYVQRTIPDISHLFIPLEESIKEKLIPALLGRKINNVGRNIFSLPVRFGGMNLKNPVETSDQEFKASQYITENLTQIIKNQENNFENYDEEDAKARVKAAKVMKENELKERYDLLMTQVSDKERRNVELAKEKGAGAWLSATPIKSLGFVLNKQEFRDSICLRYGWNIPDTPAYCQCGGKNSVDHTLSCPNGGYTIMRHNGVRDLEAELMREVCRDVKIEPELLPIGEQEMAGNVSEKARLDVSGVGVWGEHERTFLDIKIFHPNCQSYSNMDIEKAYVHHQNIKKHKYKERVLNVEHGSFTPVIFTTTGGVGPEANRHHKRIAQLMAIKKKGEYSQIISYIRTRMRFNLLKSILVAVRGERGRRTKAGPISAIEFGQIPLPED